jgi:hypothetical protein
MNPKTLANRVLVIMTIFVMVWSTGACSDTNSANNATGQNDAALLQAQVTPTNSPRIITTVGQSTNGLPTAVPTEIPLLLPTPTEVGAGTPINLTNLVPSPTVTPTNTPKPPTATPTETPLPTKTPIPAPTATPAPLVNVVGEIAVDFPTFSDVRTNFQYPITNQCISNAYINVAPVSKTAKPYNDTSIGARAQEYAWFDNVLNLYIRQPVANSYLRSGIITDAVAFENRQIEFRPDLVLIWHVLNNVAIQLIDPDTDPNVYQRAYESGLNTYVDRMLQQTRARVIIGNVPDITALWFFKSCFQPDVLKRVQQTYNDIIANVARKNPSRVFVADLTDIELAKYGQYISYDDGFWLTVGAHREVAKRFGDVIKKLGITAPEKTPSLYYPGSPIAGKTNSGSGGATTPAVPGATTPAAPATTAG